MNIHGFIILAIAVMGGVASAQSSSGPFVAGGPNALPGDRIPSALPPPRPPGPPSAPHVEPPSTAPSPTLDQASRIARAAIDACLKDGFKVGVAVVDAYGQPRALLVADGARGGHAYTAVRKALAALAFQTPTSAIPARLAAEPAAAALLTPGIMAWPGAVPLFVDGRLVGAVGASGAASLEDEACAKAGAAAR